METQQSPPATLSEPDRQADVAQRLTALAHQIKGLLTDAPSDAVWNRTARLYQLADDCKAEAEEFDESLGQRAETLTAWDEVIRTLKKGRKPAHTS